MTTDTAKKIITSICPTCGCSLIRLGIGSDRWTTTTYEGKEYFFCCQGCTDLFNEEPPKYLEETKDLVVCPTCLAEKPVQWAVRMEIAGWEVFFVDAPIAPKCSQKIRINTLNVYKVRFPMMAYLVKPGVVHQISLVSIMSRTSIALISTPLTHCHQFLTYCPMRLLLPPCLSPPTSIK